MTDLTF
jgi:zinc transporter 2